MKRTDQQTTWFCDIFIGVSIQIENLKTPKYLNGRILCKIEYGA